MALAAMMSLQTGTALTVTLAEQLGSAGAAWLRMCFAAGLMFAFVRPPRGSVSRQTLGSALLLGLMSAGMMGFFLAAAQRIDLGTASAIEFLGPLSVAVAKGNGRGRALWPTLAGAGVLCLTGPWYGQSDLLGIALALIAAAFWAGYIVQTQRASALLPGPQILAISMPFAALILTIPGASAIQLIQPWHLAAAAGVAVLSPAVPFVLELAAMRKMTTAAFGIFMSLEPAIAVIVGVVVLGQHPEWLQVLGILAVIAAAVGAEKTSGGSLAAEGRPLVGQASH